MKRNNVRVLVTMSMLVALMLLFSFTSIGYLKLGIVEITFMCLPVIIGTLCLGLVPGIILGLVFALTSLYQLLTAPVGLFGFIYAFDGLWPLILIIFLPRFLIAVTTYYADRALRSRRAWVRWGVASMIGSLTNTVLVLGMTYLFYAADLVAFFSAAMESTVLGGLGLIILTNGLPEVAAAMVICPAIMLALKKAMPAMFKNKQPQAAK